MVNMGNDGEITDVIHWRCSIGVLIKRLVATQHNDALQ
jgi:hypothetical protein